MKTTYNILGLFIFLLAFGQASWALNEGEEDKKKQEKAEVKLGDSLLILDVDAMVEDTLVYEDYDGQIPETPESIKSKLPDDGRADLIRIIVPKPQSDRSEMETQIPSAVSSSEFSLEAYPNPIPSNGQLKIRMNAQTPDAVEFWSINGQLLIKATGKETLDLTHVIPGSYFIKALKNGQVVCKKIIVTE
jgi:hypothetical protein